MKVIVTGGCGFIGSHLVEFLLDKGHDVTILDNLSTGRIENIKTFLDKVNFIECDISVKGVWVDCLVDADWVVHLAALADIVPSIQSPDSYYRANVEGTFNLLIELQGTKLKKFVYAASSSCYGIPKSFPTSELEEIAPQYPYALTKRLGEELVLHWGQVYKMPVLSLRFFNVYGPKSRTSGTYGAVMGVFLAQKLAGKPYTVVGDGTQTRDFTYVADIISAIYTALNSDKTNEIYNVGSGITVQVRKLVELLGGECVFIPERPGEPKCTYADITKISSDLGWSPKYSIEDGIGRVLKEIEYWRNAPVWTPESINLATQDWFKFLGEDAK